MIARVLNLVVLGAALLSCSKGSPPGDEVPSTTSAAALVAEHEIPLELRQVSSYELASSGPVGQLVGDAEVAPDGAFTYRLPLQLPEGRGGMAPRLALTYSSRRGNGLVGVGWALAGTSQISRCRQTPASDGRTAGIDFTEQDSLCLDGSKLILESGHHLEEGAVYRTEVSDFSKIVARGSYSGGPDAFDVYRKDGEIWTYGQTSDSRPVATQVHLDNDGHPAPVGSPQSVFAWHLSKASDRSGNYIQYKYESEPESPISVMLKEIRYTRRGADSLDGYSDGTRRVIFHTESRPDARNGYLRGVPVGVARRLSRIEVRGPMAHSTWWSEGPVWEYRLSYEEAPVTGRSRLKQVEWCDHEGVCQPPLRIKWHREPEKFIVSGATSGASGNDWVRDQHNEGVRIISGIRAVADFTGDGNDDILMSAVRGVTLLESDGFGGFVRHDIRGGQLDDMVAEWGRPADYNNDGKIDILGGFRGRPEYQQFVTWNASSKSFDIVGEKYPRHPDAHLGDLNGDGLLDLLEYRDGFWNIRLNEVLGPQSEPRFGDSVPTSVASSVAPNGIIFLDERGSGRQEAHFQGKRHRYTTVRLRRNGNLVESEYTEEQYEADPLNNRHPLAAPEVAGNYQLLDINGDGLQDVVAIFQMGARRPAEVIARLNTGLGFTEGYLPVDPWDVSGTSDRGRVPGDAGIRIVDFNGDGLDDILMFDPGGGGTSSFYEGGHVLLSDGKFFHRVELPYAGGARRREVDTDEAPGCGWCFSAVGDFDGNGTVDLAEIVNDGQGHVLQVTRRDQQHPADMVHQITSGAKDTVLAEVEFGGLSRQVRRRTVYPEPQVTLAGFTNVPLFPDDERAYRRGIFVVKAFRSFKANRHDGYLRYRYENANTDVGGRGFLGFSKVVVMDELRNAAFGLYMRNTNRVDLPNGRYAYPLANLPRSTIKISPLGLAGDGFSVVEVDRDYEVVHRDGAYSVELRGEWERNGVHQHPTPPYTPEVSRYTDREYDEFGNETRRIDGVVGGERREVRTQFVVNTSDWLISLPEKQLETSWPDFENDPETFVSRTTALEYDIHGRLSAVVHEPDALEGPEDTRLLYLREDVERDQAGLVRSVIASYDWSVGAAIEGDAGPRVTRIDYDVDGVNVLRRRNPMGHVVWQGVHRSLGIPMVTMDENGNVSRIGLDGFGRRVKEDPEGGETWRYLYSSAGDGEFVVTATGEGSGTVQQFVDVHGREYRYRRYWADGRVVTVEKVFDELGRLAGESVPFLLGEPANSWTNYTYDGLDRLTSVIHPDSRSKRRTYHGLLQVTEEDESGHQTTLMMNGDGRLTESISYGEQGPIATTYRYTAFGQVEEVATVGGDEESRVKYEYDSAGRQTVIDDPDAGRSRFEFNPFGDLQAEVNGAGERTILRRDKLGRLVEETSHDWRTTVFNWDWAEHGIGKLAMTVSPDGVVSEYRYDAHSRLAHKTKHAAGRTMSVDLDYDNFGRLQHVQYPRGAAGARLGITYEYDRTGQLEEVRDDSSPDEPLWRALERNTFGHVTLAAQGAETTVSRTYDPRNGRLRGSLAERAGVVFHEQWYSYTGTGALSSRIDAVRESSETFGYDGLDRLRSWRQIPLNHCPIGDPRCYSVPDTTRTYEYDDLGNPRLLREGEGEVSWEYSQEGFAGPHAVTSRGNVGIKYDANGRVTEKWRAGSLETRVEYNHFDLPRRVVSVGDGRQTVYQYDGEHKRVFKQDADEQIFYMDGLFEMHQDLGQPGVAGETSVFHVYAVGEEVARITRHAGGRVTEFVHSDPFGSIVAVSSAETASAASAVRRFRYDLFGGVVSEPGAWGDSSSALSRGFTGHEHELGLVNMGGRIYDPELARFLSPDPVVQTPGFGQSWNPYSYAFNSPLKYIDPSGFSSIDLSDPRIDPLWREQELARQQAEAHGQLEGQAAEQRHAARLVAGGNGSVPAVFTPGQSSDVYQSAEVRFDTFQGERWNPYQGDGALFGSPAPIPSYTAELGQLYWSLTVYGDVQTLSDPNATGVQQAMAGGAIGLSVVTGGVGTFVVRSGVRLLRLTLKGASPVSRIAPKVGGGGTLSKLSAGEIQRIQNAANRSGTEIAVVGSRVNPNKALHAGSDYDYVINANSATRRSVSTSLPGSKDIAEGIPGNQDIFRGVVDTDLPYVIFYPR